MTTKATYKRAFHPAVGPCLVPTSEEGLDQVAALKSDKEVIVHVHATRNARFHRLFFALLKHVIDGGAWDGDTDSLLDAVKLHTGHVERFVGLNGSIAYKMKSIKFESMPQDQFTRFFDRACFYISTRLLQSEDWETLRDEVIAISDGRQGEQARELAARYG